MQRETLVWTVVLLAGLLMLAGRALLVPMGRVYVRTDAYGFRTGPDGVRTPLQPVYGSDGQLAGWREEPQADLQPPAAAEFQWTRSEVVPPRQRFVPDPATGRPVLDPRVRWSWSRTLAVWTAAALTLCAVSFLWGDNVLFRVMQSLIVGVSAGYAFVVYAWSQLIPNLFGRLVPQLLEPVVPGTAAEPPDRLLIVPLVLGLMLLCRLLPRGRWIARWPLAFFIGLLAGVNLVNIFRSDFIEQVKTTVLPLIVMANGQFSLSQSLRHAGIVFGVLTSLAYFFFSVEHRGAFGWAARGGIAVLMITFGASFGLTVMTRITIFSSRLQFLFDDWLWLIDPLGSRG